MDEQALRITLEGFAGGEDTAAVIAAMTSVGRPSVEMPTGGPARWLPIPVTIREPAPGRVTQLVNRQLLNQARGGQAADYKFTLRVEMPHHDGGARETWPRPSCRGGRCWR